MFYYLNLPPFHNPFSVRMRLSNTLSDWNTGLIALGAILFVVGVGIAVALVVLLFMKIKTLCVLLTQWQHKYGKFGVASQARRKVDRPSPPKA